MPINYLSYGGHEPETPYGFMHTPADALAFLLILTSFSSQACPGMWRLANRELLFPITGAPWMRFKLKNRAHGSHFFSVFTVRSC